MGRELLQMKTYIITVILFVMASLLAVKVIKVQTDVRDSRINKHK